MEGFHPPNNYQVESQELNNIGRAERIWGGLCQITYLHYKVKRKSLFGKRKINRERLRFVVLRRAISGERSRKPNPKKEWTGWWEKKRLLELRGGKEPGRPG